MQRWGAFCARLGVAPQSSGSEKSICTNSQERREGRGKRAGAEREEEGGTTQGTKVQPEKRRKSLTLARECHCHAKTPKPCLYLESLLPWFAFPRIALFTQRFTGLKHKSSPGSCLWTSPLKCDCPGPREVGTNPPEPFAPRAFEGGDCSSFPFTRAGHEDMGQVLQELRQTPVFFETWQPERLKGEIQKFLGAQSQFPPASHQ